MQRPLDFILNSVKESLDAASENEKSNFKSLEKLFTWIVGFSIAAFAFIVSRISELETLYGHRTLKWILIILCVSIFAAIAHRIAFFVWKTNLQILNRNFKMMFGKTEDVVEVDAQNVHQENDIKEVVRLLKENFGEDLSYILPIYETADEGKKLDLLENMKNHYEKVKVWAKSDYQNALKLVKNFYKEAFGATDKEADKVLNADAMSMVRLYKKITFFTFWLSLLSFTTTIIILITKF